MFRDTWTSDPRQPGPYEAWGGGLVAVESCGGPGPGRRGTVLGVLGEVAGGFIAGGVHEPVQQLRPPLQVGQALVRSAPRVVLGVVQQTDGPIISATRNLTAACPSVFGAVMTAAPP